MPPVYFPIVSNTVDHQLKTNQLFAPIIDQQAYTGPLAFLLLAWLAASVVTAILLLALFFPGPLRSHRLVASSRRSAADRSAQLYDVNAASDNKVREPSALLALIERIFRLMAQALAVPRPRDRPTRWTSRPQHSKIPVTPLLPQLTDPAFAGSVSP
jgi:hypothetical protein